LPVAWLDKKNSFYYSATAELSNLDLPQNMTINMGN